jgi:hypothetical protein
LKKTPTQNIFFTVSGGTPTEVKDYKAPVNDKIFLQTASTLSTRREGCFIVFLGKFYPIGEIRSANLRRLDGPPLILGMKANSITVFTKKLQKELGVDILESCF